MSGRKSKTKGHNYERKLCKVLTDHYGVRFRRTPSSGMWDKSGEVSGWAPGDVICKDLSFPWCIELKKVEGWTMEAILRGTCGEFTDWWGQTVETAEEVENVRPLLIFSRNYQGDFVAAEADSFRHFPDNVLVLGSGAHIVYLEEWFDNHIEWTPEQEYLIENE